MSGDGNDESETNDRRRVEDDNSFDILDYILHQGLTLALEIGMTPQQYFYDNPQLFYNYADCFEAKKKREIEHLDYLAWNIMNYLATVILQPQVVVGVSGDNVKDRAKIKIPEEPNFMKTEREEKNKLSEEEKHILDDIKESIAIHNLKMSNY